MGVSGQAESICIEKQSFNNEYWRGDITGQFPINKCCKENAVECLETGLNVVELCEAANTYCKEKSLKSRVIESCDPGRYKF